MSSVWANNAALVISARYVKDRWTRLSESERLDAWRVGLREYATVRECKDPEQAARWFESNGFPLGSKAIREQDDRQHTDEFKR